MDATPPKIALRLLSAQSDARLLRLLRQGESAAFDEIVRRHRPPLVAFAGSIVPADMAEDVVQAALVSADRALREDERQIELRPWLFTIVRNRALNELRRERPHVELDESYDGGAQPPEIAAGRERFRTLVTAIDALPRAQRDAIVKRELEGLGHEEIARQLETTPTAVRGMIYRARAGLRGTVGAIFPLPLLRYLLSPEAASAATAGGSAAGTGGPLAAAATTKAGVALTAIAAIAAGGIAINPGPSADAPASADRGTAVGGLSRGADRSSSDFTPIVTASTSGRRTPGSASRSGSGAEGGGEAGDDRTGSPAEAGGGRDGDDPTENGGGQQPDSAKDAPEAPEVEDAPESEQSHPDRDVTASDSGGEVPEPIEPIAAGDREPGGNGQPGDDS